MSETKTTSPAETFFPKDFYCPITLELFQDPYIGPSNLTFEYSALISHFAVSNKHPITRVKSSIDEFGPNISLRNSIQSMQEEYAKRNIAISTKWPSSENSTKSSIETILVSKAIVESDVNGIQTGVICITNTSEQPGSDITIIIDHSGSMGCSAGLKGDDGRKRENGMTLQNITNASAVAVLESLTETDRVCVIKYNGTVEVVSPLSFATSACKKDLSVKIKAIRSGGQTNIWGALRESLEQYKANPVSGRKQTIILLTDGVPNICPSRGEKHALTEWYNENPDQKIDIHTVGFGNSIDSNLLEDIANVGIGTYNFLPSPDMIGTIFVNLAANCLSSSNIMPVIDIHLKDGNKFANPPVPGMTTQVSLICDTHIKIKCPRLKCKAPFTIAFELDPGNKKITTSDFEITAVSDAFSEVRSGETINNIANHIARNLVIKGICKINNLMSLGSPNIKEVYSATLKELQIIHSSGNHNCCKHYVMTLMSDWEKQVMEAANMSAQPRGRTYWQTWGRHWLKSLKMAHMYQYTNNFRDPGIQNYGKECILFEVLQDKIGKIFDALPPPKPSIHVGLESRCHSMAAYNNQSYNGCFDGNCQVYIQPYDAMERVVPVNVHSLKKGDRVVTSMSGASFKTLDTIECVVRTKCTDVRDGKPVANYIVFDNGLCITKFHPVFDGNHWKFPADMEGIYNSKECEYVYDVVLKNRSSTIMVNNIMVATLGHGLQGDVIGHEYFGDKIIDDLKNLNGYYDGLVTTNGFKRNNITGLIDGLY